MAIVVDGFTRFSTEEEVIGSSQKRSRDCHWGYASEKAGRASFSREIFTRPVLTSSVSKDIEVQPLQSIVGKRSKIPLALH